MDCGDERPSAGRPPDLARALRAAFLQDIGLDGIPAGARVVGHYLLLEPIGAGSGGTVWRALHRDLLNEVAVKLVEPRSSREAGDPERVERFRREAAIAARLHHPGIVAVHDFGSEDGTHYLAMDLVRGRAFDVWLAEDRPDLERRLALLERVARAAHYAHQHGVVHRDLKPANVVVTDGDAPVIVDFGVARTRDDARLTRDGAVVGTVAFMAPEQLRAEHDVDVRADIWALGTLLYLAATTTLPFPVDGTPADALRARATPPIPPTRRDPALPAAIDVLVQRCLERDAALRLPSAAALAEDLARVRRGEPIVAGATTPARLLWRKVASRPLRAALVSGAAVAFVLAAGLLMRTSRQEHELTVAHETIDQKSRVVEIQGALLDLTPRLKPLLVRAERLRYAAAPAAEAPALQDAIEEELRGSGDATGVGDAWRAWSLFLLDGGESSRADDAFASAKRLHPGNPFVRVLAARRELRRCADDIFGAPSQPLTFELLVEPLATPAQLLARPAAKSALASAREELEQARRLLLSETVPSLEWVLRLCDGFERFATGDAAGAIERLTPLARYDEIDLEATLLLCFALLQARRAPDAIEHARWLHDLHPYLVPASKLLALCLQAGARDRLERGESPILELEEAQRVLAGVTGSMLIDDVVGAQIDFDLECARFYAGTSSPAGWEPIIARWIDLRDRTLATGADARARGAAYARVGWARSNAALLWMPRASALAGLRAAAEEFRVAAQLAPDSPWVVVQRIASRALVQELLARLGLPIEEEEIDGALHDVEHLREIEKSGSKRNDWALAQADLGEAQLRFSRALAGGAAGVAGTERANEFDRAAELAHAATERYPTIVNALNVELESRLHALLARAAPIEGLRDWSLEFRDDSLSPEGGDIDARWIRPLTTAALAASRSDRNEVAGLAVALARRCASILPDDAKCAALVAEGELALRFVDAGGAAVHVDAALAALDAFLARHAADPEATVERGFALAALADLGGREGHGEEECLEEIRNLVAAPPAESEADIRALLLDAWLAHRDGDESREREIAGRIASRIAADPDARLAVEIHLKAPRAALAFPGEPKEAVDSARAWDSLARAIASDH
jgi:protein kinase-like protein